MQLLGRQSLEGSVSAQTSCCGAPLNSGFMGPLREWKPEAEGSWHCAEALSRFLRAPASWL
jgi:hypothetical protein